MPGNWTIDATCLPDLPLVGDPTYTAAVASMDAAKDLAVQVLWALSGRQYGVFSTVVRPCPEGFPAWMGREWFPRDYEVYSLYGSGWFATGCGCIGSCVETGPSAAHLPGPVSSITSVTMDGAVIPSSSYTLEGDVLYRTGAAWWPSQDLSKPATEAGTWKVTYLRGLNPPAGTAKLAGLLAAEFYNSCTGGKCRLPRTVTEVSRQGVSHRMVNPQDIYASGKTGIAEIDLWLAAVNPNHLAEAPSVS